MTAHLTTTHEDKLDYVMSVLKATGARRVLDLGCGSGLLLYRMLVEPQFEEIVGLEESGASLVQARTMLARYLEEPKPRLRLLRGSYADKKHPLLGFDAAAMVETIEHVYPRDLSRVETAVFGYYQPSVVFMTTPNGEYNPVFGLQPGEFREPDHKFEWSRQKFQQWARGVAQRNGYRVRFGGLGDYYPELGEPTQTAFFTRE